jgi:hypothetical protein
MQLTATVSTVRAGFSYERTKIVASSWPDLSAQLEQAIRQLLDENPDSILVKMDRPR